MQEKIETGLYGKPAYVNFSNVNYIIVDDKKIDGDEVEGVPESIQYMIKLRIGNDFITWDIVPKRYFERLVYRLSNVEWVKTHISEKDLARLYAFAIGKTMGTIERNDYLRLVSYLCNDGVDIEIVEQIADRYVHYMTVNDLKRELIRICNSHLSVINRDHEDGLVSFKILR